MFAFKVIYFVTVHSLPDRDGENLNVNKKFHIEQRVIIYRTRTQLRTFRYDAFLFNFENMLWFSRCFQKIPSGAESLIVKMHLCSIFLLHRFVFYTGKITLYQLFHYKGGNQQTERKHKTVFCENL